MTATAFQPDLFTIYARSPEQWRADAEKLVSEFAATGRPFTADDLRDAGLAEPDHQNRWGGLFRTMAGWGVIRCVGVANSRKPSRHGSLGRVWQGVVS